jgi:hypothetical protein
MFFTSGGNERLRIASNGNIGIGTATPITILDIYKSSYTGPLLCLDTGIVSAGAGVIPQSIGKPLLRLGKLGYSQTTGDYYGIGFGYAPAITDFNCAEIGTLITSTAGNETGDLVFSTRPNTTNVAATERMRIASNGNIGIGTTVAPSNSLTGTPQLVVGSIGYGISGDSEDTASGIYIGDAVPGARWKLVHGSYHLNLHQNNGSGTYNYRGAFANNTGTYSSVSDKRLKKNIEPIQYGLKDVLKFKPVSYFMENQNEDIDKKNLGFLAQDLEDIVPEIVNVQSSNDSNYIYSLQYSSIIPILIKAIQELNEIVLHNNTSNLVNV